MKTEKTKQETLEEASEKWLNKDGFNIYNHYDTRPSFIAGAKWQQQQNKNLYIELAEMIVENYSISYMTDDGIETSKLKKEKVLKIANDYINELNLQSSK